MAASGREAGSEVSQEVTQAVLHAQWEQVVSLVRSADCSDRLRHWAIQHIVQRAPQRFVQHRLDDILDCAGDWLDIVVSRLFKRRLWMCAGRVLQRDISHNTLRSWVVKEALKHGADDDDVVEFILPHCSNEELEHIINIFVSQGWWRLVGEVLGRGISTEQRRKAVEEAVKRYAADDVVIKFILPHYSNEELEHIINIFVSQGEWGLVGKVLGWGISTEQHRWAVEEALKHADEEQFADYILHHCTKQDLEQVLTHMVSRGLWKPVDSVKHNVVSFTQHELSQIVSQIPYRALGSGTHSDVSITQHVLSQIVSRGLWKAVGRFIQRGVSSAEHMRAVEQASRHAGDVNFVLYILPQCHDEEVEHVTTHLVSRGMWMSVGKVLQRGVSPEQHKWAVKQASRHAGDDDFVRHILPQCRDEELRHVTAHLVSRGMWMSVGKVLQRGVSNELHRWVVVEAAIHASDYIFCTFILNRCSAYKIDVFPLIVAKKKWRCTRRVLYGMVRDTLYKWMTSGHDSRAHDTVFWKFIHYCHVDVSLALDLTKAVTQKEPRKNRLPSEALDTLDDLAQSVFWQEALCETLMTSLLHTLCYVMCGDDREYTDSTEHTKQCVSDIYTHITACIKDNTDSIQDNTLKIIEDRQKWTSVFTEIADSHKTDRLFLLHFLQGLNLYRVSRRGTNDDAILLVMLAVFPLFPQLQSVALRMMLREKRWEVIRRACLSHVWEHDRRRLFKAAVMQRQWDVVRQWSDHTVHDDQREWAMEEAFKEEEWEVYLLLADHGLTMPEQMHAHYMVAKYGDWDTVLQMVERGGDITEVSNLLENWVTRNLRKKPQGDVTVYMKRCEKLIRLRLRFAKEAVLSPMKALQRWRWGSVLFNILHEPTDDYFSRVLNKLIVQQEWHILMHLVRLGMNKAERNWLFPEMVRQQQWGVCRMLLEYGVDEQLCVEALPELMERNQWTLVARVMDYNVDDAVRRQVMQCAFQRREGALFWHCLTVMNYKQHLSRETQGKLFHQAISREIWQAVNPLIVEKDGPRIQHRDMAFLEAIEQHLWDVVDYCQLHRADINMEDENGETPLHREARKEEWEAVKEIVLRDGKPNLLDKDGVSVLRRLIHNKQWDIVKIVIMYGGDIHLPARHHENGSNTLTPLVDLIDVRQADIIQFSIMWCGDQKKGLNDRGETCFHAVCDSDRRWDVMEDLIVRKVDPLAVTKTGKSALAYAVLNTKCPERMVAECSKLGFSSHQPSVTGPQESLLDDIIHTAVRGFEKCLFHPPKCIDCDTLRWESMITSPLVCAVLRDSPVLVLMLYESGSCSTSELVTLYTQLPKLTDLNTEEGGRLYEEVQRIIQDSWHRLWAEDLLQQYSRLTHTLGQHTVLLRELATTPRTLLSSCRLMITHRFNFRDTYRHEKMNELPLPESVKNYLEFSDLCDPGYGSDML